MSRHIFENDCPGCKPVLMDLKGNRLAKDHPAMVAMMEVWDGLTVEDRNAFHRVCCLNSRDPVDMAVTVKIRERMAAKA